MKSNRRIRLVALTVCTVGLGWLAAAGAWARTGELTLKNGLTHWGDITRNDDGSYSVNDSGISQSFTQAEVADVSYYASIQDAYKQKSARLKPDDVAGHSDLAQWCIDHEHYAGLKEQAELILAKQPENANAKLWLRISERDKTGPTTRPDGTDKPTVIHPPVVDPAKQIDKLQRLTERDINVIRIMELRPGERDVRIVLAKGATDLFWQQLEGHDRYRTDAEKRAFFASSPQEQIEALMNNSQITGITDVTLYKLADDRMADGHKAPPLVSILSDPRTLRRFRFDIHPWLLSNLTDAPAGSADAKLFYNAVPIIPAKDEAAVYTNFYRLMTYQTKGLYMIDTGKPEASLILNWPLPTDAVSPEFAVVPPPLAKDQPFKPGFRNRNDRNYQRIMQWIQNDLKKPHIAYQVVFPPPETKTPAGKTAPTGVQPPPAMPRTGPPPGGM
ncbi:MAG: hypothetical protein BIFFINMI_03753 [Phycisphaerae bacterium]|nr:hypothetical protein [Phycisphaerae bacterium]